MDFETFLLDEEYDTTLEGGKIFCFLLEEVLCLLDAGRTDRQIKKELRSIYSSYIYRFFRTDGDTFFNYLIVFLRSKKRRRKGGVGRVDDALIRLAKKYRMSNELDNSVPKKMVKRR